MTPPCYTFPAAELTERVQLDVQGRQRKMPPATTAQQTDKNAADGNGKSTSSSGGNRHQGIDLARDCMLLSQMVQYSCAVMHPEMRDSPVRCWPVQRMFRKCQDKHGSFMVETTAWEGTDASRSSSAGSIGSAVTDAGTDAAAGHSPASGSSAAPTGAGPSQRPETLRVFG